MVLRLNEEISPEIVPEQMYQDSDEEFFEQDQVNLLDMFSKLNGAILRKAEFENNFDKVYSLVFEKISQLRSGEDFLTILGEIGG